MAGYGNAVDPITLLEAMRDKGKADTSKIHYVDDIKIVNAIDERVVKSTSLFLFWTGSPEETFGESVRRQLFRARHQIQIIAVQVTVTPEHEATVIGTGHSPGIAKVCADVLDFYANNLLGLSAVTQLEEPGPTCSVESVNTFQIEDTEDQFLVTAIINYEALTRPFLRARVA